MALTTGPVIAPQHGRRFVIRRTRAGGTTGGEPATAPTGIPGGVATAAGWGRRYSFRLVLADLVGLLVAAQVVHPIRVPPGTADGAVGLGSLPYVALTAVLVIVWMLALTWSGSRDPTTIGYGAIEYHRVVRATLAVFGVAAIASYLLKFDLPGPVSGRGGHDARCVEPSGCDRGLRRARRLPCSAYPVDGAGRGAGRR